ncbi:YceD family protein [Lacticaseibacillus zhaodongensis]|uniref:YceD family protein n=1 Tax=Lacticaseibacillus zhaodongensis TaxID=2668065 RepID=UPI0012D32E29|nr:YceD family protein [Lacticaseibacillus zhaodongensis]
MLKWSTSNLREYNHKPLAFDETLALKKELMERDPELIDLDEVRVQGEVLYSRGDFVVTGELNTQATLPSTRSLTPTTVPVHFEFKEIYLSDPDHAEDYEDDDLLIPLDSEWLDLMPAVKDNVLLALPLRVLTPEEQSASELPSGDNWTLMSEDDLEEAKPAPEERPNNPFASLKGLFPDDGKDDQDKQD